MKLYYVPGACSLSDHIALHEAGLDATFEKVDLKTRTTQTGADYLAINPKGYVPALVLDDGEIVTENIAILSWIAAQAPALAPTGPLAATRLLEALAYISTEVHHGFKPFVHGGSKEDRAKAADATFKRFELIAKSLVGPYLFGSRFTVADCYLFVMLTWARRLDVSVPPALAQYFERVMEREAVRRSLAEEGLG
jgi:glutathione S-transferase